MDFISHIHWNYTRKIAILKHIPPLFVDGAAAVEKLYRHYAQGGLSKMLRRGVLRPSDILIRGRNLELYDPTQKDWPSGQSP